MHSPTQHQREREFNEMQERGGEEGSADKGENIRKRPAEEQDRGQRSGLDPLLTLRVPRWPNLHELFPLDSLIKRRYCTKLEGVTSFCSLCFRRADKTQPVLKQRVISQPKLLSVLMDPMCCRSAARLQSHFLGLSGAFLQVRQPPKL